MSTIPAFPGTHNGVPARLREDATIRKTEHFALRTKTTLDPRDEDVPVLPPGISREGFGLAMEELKESIGDANVVLNDKPLDDGWYENLFPFNPIEEIVFLYGWLISSKVHGASYDS